MMNVSPFSNFTLLFHNTTLEDKYQKQILEQKLTYFRLLMSITVLITLGSLFISIIQQWKIYLVISLSVQIVLYFLTIIFSRKISPYLKYILPLLYVVQYTFFMIGALENLLQPHYVYGFIGGIFSSCMLNYLSVKIKIIILLSSIWIQLGIFNIYSLTNLNYIILGIGSTCLQMFFAYLYEYNSRLTFSQGMIIKLQNKLVYEFTTQKFLILRFNKNKTLFELDFANQKFEQIYKFENNQDNVKVFLRNHFIINLATHQMFGSLKVQKFANKQITLEDLLFEIYRAKSEEFNLFQMIDQNQNQHEIQVQIINDLNTQFLITIKENNSVIQIEKYEKKIQIRNQLSQNFSILVGQKLQSVYKSIFDLESYQYENQALNNILANIQYILNESKNQLMFFSQDKIHQLLKEIDHCFLSTVILALKPYFVNQCQRSKIQFELQFQIDKDNVEMKISTKQLTQLLINIFNKILTYTKLQSTIILKISKENNLNPLQNSFQQSKSSSSKYDYLCSSQENNQLLINFNFIFKTNQEINNFERCFTNQKNEFEQNDDLITIVNSLLLKQISPYNKIFIIQEKISRSLNTNLRFFIYSDQTQIDPSYCKYLKQQNIIN